MLPRVERKTDLERDREEPCDDGRTRLLPDPSLRAPLLDLLLDFLVPFLASPSQLWKSWSSSVSLWLRLGRLPAVLDERRWPPARGTPFEAAAAPSTAKRTATAKPSRANRRWPIVRQEHNLSLRPCSPMLNGTPRFAFCRKRGYASAQKHRPYPAVGLLPWGAPARAQSGRSSCLSQLLSATMKAPSLFVLAGAGLTSAFIAPPVPMGRQSYASPRSASQRDTLVASAGVSTKRIIYIVLPEHRRHHAIRAPESNQRIEKTVA